MPDYKYKCRECKHIFHRTLAMRERNGVTCELCMGEVSIVPQRTGVLVPAHWHPSTAITKAELTEPSGLLAQEARHG